MIVYVDAPVRFYPIGVEKMSTLEVLCRLAYGT